MKLGLSGRLAQATIRSPLTPLFLLAALAVAGSLSGKRTIAFGEGTMRTDTVVFAVLLVATISIVALLTFVPALMLGPAVQALTPRLF